MKEIKLTQDQVAQVDDEDYDKVNRYNWYALYTPETKSFRAARTDYKTRKTIYLHCFVMNTLGIDHIDHDTLNNQKYNLRKCTVSQNNRNRKKSLGFSSLYKGVSWYKTYNKWKAEISFNYKKITIGYFSSKTDAAAAYNKSAIEHFGEFAYLNVI